MIKKRIYIITVLLFIAAIALLSIRQFWWNRSAIAFYDLKERKGALALAPEWSAIRQTAASLMSTIRERPDDKKAFLSLAALFLQEARVTGNYAYYDRAALRQVNHVLELDGNDFQALTFKALIYLSQHHFADGLSIARKAVTLNPYNAFIYGVLIDATVEMGYYKDAISYADKMISIRPDLRSYSRISYIREIFGDYPGAIEAMKMAVDAGLPGDESTEWARVQLGRLYEYTGAQDTAALQYAIAADERPDYPYALAGLARIAVANKEYKKAISYYTHIDSLINDYTINEELIDTYQESGQSRKADSLSLVVIEEMSANARQAANDENIGHYADKELAYAYLKINEPAKALEHALTEYNRRPENIEANETVAWAYYKTGNYSEALPYIQKALRTKCRNPVLLCHASLIYERAGNRAMAETLLNEALKNHPNIPELLKTEALKAIQVH